LRKNLPINEINTEDYNFVTSIHFPIHWPCNLINPTLCGWYQTVKWKIILLSVVNYINIEDVRLSYKQKVCTIPAIGNGNSMRKFSTLGLKLKSKPLIFHTLWVIFNFSYQFPGHKDNLESHSSFKHEGWLWQKMCLFFVPHSQLVEKVSNLMNFILVWLTAIRTWKKKFSLQFVSTFVLKTYFVEYLKSTTLSIRSIRIVKAP